MVKVYDMVTFGVSEPDVSATPMQDNTSALELARAVPELGLQLIEATPIAARPDLPPALRHTDAEHFLRVHDKR